MEVTNNRETVRNEALGLLGQSGRQDIASPSMTLAQSNLYISLDYDLPVMTDDNCLGFFWAEDVDYVPSRVSTQRTVVLLRRR